MHQTIHDSDSNYAVEQQLSFDTHPDRYRHWELQFDGPVAHLCMNVDESGGQFSGYELKKNSYDIGVDIELYDAVQRLRFEHPEVRTVVMTLALQGMLRRLIVVQGDTETASVEQQRRRSGGL